MTTSRTTDSPWFWVCVFASAALVALAVLGPKFAARQSQLERRYQARQRSGQSVVGQGEARGPAVGDRTRISLRPLYAVISVVLIVAWCILAWQYFRAQARKQASGAQQNPNED